MSRRIVIAITTCLTVAAGLLLAASGPSAGTDEAREKGARWARREGWGPYFDALYPPRLIVDRAPGVAMPLHRAHPGVHAGDHGDPCSRSRVNTPIRAA